MGAREMKIEGNSLLEFFDGFGQKACFAISATKDNAQLGPVSELLDHPVKNLLRGSNLMLLEIRKT